MSFGSLIRDREDEYRARSRVAEPSSTGPASAGKVTAQPGVAAIWYRHGAISPAQDVGKQRSPRPGARFCLLSQSTGAKKYGRRICRGVPRGEHQFAVGSDQAREQTGEEAQRAIGEGVASIDRAREQLVAGAPVSEIVDDLVARGGRGARPRSSAAIDAFEHAVWCTGSA